MNPENFPNFYSPISTTLAIAPAYEDVMKNTAVNQIININVTSHPPCINRISKILGTT